MNFLEEFIKRGYFYQCTDLQALKTKIKGQKIVAYIGFDCTARSLHIGNLMQIMILRLLQQHNHKPVVLIGGTTTRIGDPTGKTKIRKCFSDKELEYNILGIKESLSKFIRFGNGSSDAILLNNSQWLNDLSYVEFLGKIGRIVSINHMLGIDFIRSRLEKSQPLTFLEFNYMLLQAYDFYYLNKKYNCVLQIGGSDQWGNIVTGVELIRKINMKQSFGLTTPLLTTTSGIKMGKSIDGAIWLNEDQLSAYDYYQYWRNVEDKDVIRFAKLFCEFSEQELQEFVDLSKKNINAAKKKLAYVMTLLCHGKQKANSALNTSINVFELGTVGDDLVVVRIPKSCFEFGIPCYSLFFKSGLTKSKSESRRLIRGGGARINNIQVEDENLEVNKDFIIYGNIKLSFGKKKHVLVKVI
jgi:tyrosyl-tRNA synthetase